VPPKAVCVKVDGLDSVERRDALIKSLLGVKGVTSVTVDQRKGAVIAYTYKSVEEIRTDMLEAIKVAETTTSRTTLVRADRACVPVVVRSHHSYHITSHHME
jgi:hypothetical protein